MSIVGLIILVSSLLGYNNILRILDINAYLSWITSMLVQTILLYIFAMLGYLHLGIYIVTLMGVVFFISTLLLVFFKKRKLKHTKKIYWFDIWMLIFGLLLINVLHNSPLVHYDNYSHWATIIKFLVFEGHLPDAAQKLITFTSYPPATALFITNFVFWVHFSESAMLIGQFVLIWAALYAMFGVLRDRMRSLNTFVICFVISLIQIFNISIRMNNLLVDFLLPLIAVAGLIGIYMVDCKIKPNT
ncbi:hypothetical protein [Leuconostoc citreum]|uniref:hypothetical protein n=1 Tax=Leuconostoc citreum TaxID=33964 RepID=UPI0012FDAA92|nr:hypothetical protein [Leuconostoc citreum]